MIETAHLTDHVSSADALVYAVGSLKFLSGNSSLLKILHKKGCFEGMSKLLKNINKTVQKYLMIYISAKILLGSNALHQIHVCTCLLQNCRT